jgi:hypothetical protein
MAVKVTSLRILLWKIKSLGLFRFPPAFWFGFWFVFGAYWAVVAIGWISRVGQMVFGEV